MRAIVADLRNISADVRSATPRERTLCAPHGGMAHRVVGSLHARSAFRQR